jgi:hypothetical protein
MIRSIGALGASVAIVATVAVAPAVASTPREFHFAGVVDPASVTPTGFTLKADAGSNGPAVRVVLAKGRTLALTTNTDTQYITRSGYALGVSSQADFAATVAANAGNRVDTRVRVLVRTAKYRWSKKHRKAGGVDPHMVLSTPAYRVVDITNASRPKGLVPYVYRGTCTGVTETTVSLRVDGGNWRGMRSVLRAAATDGSLNTVQTFRWNAGTQFARWVGGKLRADGAQAALGAACVPGSTSRIGVTVWAARNVAVSDLTSGATAPTPVGSVNISEPAEKD